MPVTLKKYLAQQGDIGDVTYNRIAKKYIVVKENPETRALLWEKLDNNPFLNCIDLAIKIVLALNKLKLNTPPQYLKEENHNRKLTTENILIDDDNNISFAPEVLTTELPANISAEEWSCKSNTMLVNSIFKNQGGNSRLFSGVTMDCWKYPDEPTTTYELLQQLEYFKFVIEGRILEGPGSFERGQEIKSAEHLIYVLYVNKIDDVLKYYNCDLNKIRTILKDQNEHVWNALSYILNKQNRPSINNEYAKNLVACLTQHRQNSSLFGLDSASKIPSIKTPEFDSIDRLKKQESDAAELNHDFSAPHSASSDVATEIIQRTLTPNEASSDVVPKTNQDPVVTKTNQDSSNSSSSARTKGINQLIGNINKLMENMKTSKQGWKERWSLVPPGNIKMEALSNVQMYLSDNKSTIDNDLLQGLNKLVLNICQYKRHAMNPSETHSSKEFKDMYSNLKDSKDVMSHENAKELIQKINSGDDIKQLAREQINPSRNVSIKG